MTFTVILLCCIIVILFAVSSNIADESFAVQREIMNSSAGSASIVLESHLSDVGYEGIYSAFGEQTDMQRLIDYLTDGAKTEIYVFDKNGILVGSTDRDIPAGLARLSESALNVMLSNNDSYSISTVEGFFRSNRFNSYLATYVGDDPFIVMVSLRNYTGVVFTKDIIIVAITVALWVFLAAMISLYVISRRITQPLSEIISAAKDYSKGRFDRKIDVIGYDEVAELANAINDMAASLASIESERNSFIGNVSHDLRTPMTTISGFVDGILDGTIPPEKHEYYLNIISQEVKRLSRLVNTLLDAARSESGATLKRTDFNLSETARTVLISLESKISAKNIDIEFDSGEEDIFVNADPDSIHRVIFNLMDNAVKFTPEKGIISIGITTIADGRKKRKAVFTIRNSGEGIPKEELPNVFKRFYKTDRSRGLDKSGTGLGLYIANTSIVNHGETLSVDSVSGEYTEFRFTLPVGRNNKA